MAARLAAQQPVRPLVAAFAGFAPEGITPDLTFRLEHLGSTLADLRAQGVDEVCMIGAVRRPVIDPAEIDAATVPLVPRIAQALTAGDDAALRIMIEILEEHGFAIRGAHELAGDMLPAPGLLAGDLTDTAEADAARAQQVMQVLGPLDVGQACVVARGQVIAMEAMPGTDWMLRSLILDEAAFATVPGQRGAPVGDAGLFGALGDPLGSAADWLTGPAGAQNAEAPPLRRDPATGTGGILYKAPKPGQDLRVDMPTIGADTIAAAALAGLDGVVVQAGAVMVVDPEACRRAAADAGLFLWVRE